MRYMQQFRHLFIIALLSLSYLLSANEVDNHTNLAELDEPALLQQQQTWFDLWAYLEQRHVVLVEQHHKLEQKHKDLLHQRPHIIASPADPHILDQDLNLADIERLNQQAKAYQTALNEQASFIKQQQDLAYEQKALALELVHETEQLQAAQKEAQAGLAEIEKRQLLEVLTEILADNQGDKTEKKPAQWRTSLDKLKQASLPDTDEWLLFSNKQASFLEQLEQALPVLQQAENSFLDYQHLLDLYAQEQTEVQQWQDKFSADDAPKLNSHFVKQHQLWDESQAALAKLEQQRQQQRNQIDQLNTQLAALSAPEINQLLGADSKEDNVTQAQAAVAQSQESLRYWQARLDYLSQLQQQQNDLVATLEDYETQLKTSSARERQLYALGEVLKLKLSPEKLPELIQSDALKQVLKKQRYTHKNLFANKDKVSAHLQTLEEELQQARVEVENFEIELQQSQQLLAREQEWQQFLQKIEPMDNAKLLQVFKDNLQDYQQLQTKLETGQAQVAAQAQQVSEENLSLSAHKDPTGLDYIDDENSFKQWYQSEYNLTLDTVEKNNVAAEDDNLSAAETVANTKITASDKTQTQSVFYQKILAWKNAITDSQNQSFLRYSSYLEDKQSLETQLVKVRREYQGSLEKLFKSYDDSLKAARHAWGSALVLQKRQKTQPKMNLPKSINEWQSRNRVESLQQGIAQVNQAIEDNLHVLKRYEIAEPAAEASLSDEHANADSLAALTQTLDTGANNSVNEEPEAHLSYEYLMTAETEAELLTALKKSASNSELQLQKLTHLLKLEQAYELTQFEQLNEFEKHRYEARLRKRIKEDQSLEDLLLSFFANQQVEDIDQLLRSHYENLVEIEHQLKNIEAKRKTIEDLIAYVELSRPTVSEVLALIETINQQSVLRLRVRAHRLKAIFHPEEQLDIQEQFYQQQGFLLDLEGIPLLPSKAEPEKRQEMQEHLLQDLFEYWTNQRGYEAWTQGLGKYTEKLGGLDQRISHFKELIAELEHSQFELAHERQGLLGKPLTALAELPPEQHPQTHAEVEQFSLGEIGLLRKERAHALRWASIETSFWLFMIPILAILAISFVNWVGRKWVDKAKKLVADMQARGEVPKHDPIGYRQLIYKLVRNVWTVAVIIITIIAMFKAIHIDVLPLLASAGIFGLALAFGAQQLVRDFFSGFFILLEDQFRAGESVIINDVRGEIEQVTPRLTLLRDLEGGLHYIPNGSIDSVDNLSRGWGAVNIDVAIDSSHDDQEVLDCLQSTADKLKADPTFQADIQKIKIVGIMQFDAHQADYRVKITTVPMQQAGIARAYKRLLKTEFNQHGIALSQSPLLNMQKTLTAKT